jgi:hypothetical protein
MTNRSQRQRTNFCTSLSRKARMSRRRVGKRCGSEAGIATDLISIKSVAAQIYNLTLQVGFWRIS